MEIENLSPEYSAGGRADIRLPGASFHVRGLGGHRPGELDEVIFLSQVHGDRIIRDPAPGQEADGMIVTDGTLSAGIRTADCLPVFLWSGRFHGAFHAGWRGIASGIAEKMLCAFPTEVNYVLLGNCICPDCYSVGEDVRTRVTDGYVSNHPPGALDLSRAVLDRLERAGLPDSVRVFRLDGCTCCRGDLFHSYRRDGTDGRNVQWLRIEL